MSTYSSFNALADGPRPPTGYTRQLFISGYFAKLVNIREQFAWWTSARQQIDICGTCHAGDAQVCHCVMSLISVLGCAGTGRGIGHCTDHSM
jgi:hypothetical protein